MASIKQEQQDYYYPRPNAENLLNIPATLKRSCTWVCWREEPGDNQKDKPDKIPVNPRTGKNAKSNNPKTGGTYDQALAYFEANPAMRGIGFILSEDDEFCGLDLDKVIDPTGAIDNSAAALVRLVDSYTEVTASGSGLRVIVLAKLNSGCKFKYENRLYEIYDRLRFLTVTGARLPNTSPAVWDRQAIVDSLVPASSRAPKPTAAPPRARDPLAPAVDAIGDDEIVKLIEASPRAEKFRALMAGETTGYSGFFAATLALAIIVAQFTRSNPERMDKIVRASGLVAGWEQWWDEKYGDGRTRGERTIAAACAAAATLWRYSPEGDYIVNKSGDVKPLLANSMTAIKEAPEFAGVLAYNEFSLYTTTKEAAPWQKTGGTNWTDHDDSKLAEWLQRRGVCVNTQTAAEAAQAVARENSFHPVKNYLNGLTWDGTERIDDWLTTYLGVASTPYSRAVGPRWLVSAIARIFQPGCQADYTLVLEGAQGKLKSTALRTLAGDEYFTDHISDLQSKDARLDLHGRLIVELAELSSVRRSSVQTVKNFLTARFDNFRPPYGRRTEMVPRSNVFAGSVNDAQYLSDETGNRRFWPAKCGEIKIAKLAEDRDQLWAEALTRYDAGRGVWWLDKDELEDLAREEQEERYEPGVWDDIIIAWLDQPERRSAWIDNPDFRPNDPSSTAPAKIKIDVDPFDASTYERVTVNDVLIHAVGKNVDQLKQPDRNQVTRCLTHAGWKLSREMIGGKKRRCYLPPEENEL